MRNESKSSKIKKIISLVKNLPYFSFDNLATIEKDRFYLKVLFSRYEKAGKSIRLKRGFYVTKDYIENLQKHQRYSLYLEFLANVLYTPSYLSLEYILYQHNLLSEVPNNFTLVTKNKTAYFSNAFGNFFYHKVKDKLFLGFEIIKENDFIIYRATKSKALFDYLYLRKNVLINKKTVEELRLNINNLDKKDINELRKYFKIESSKKMTKIYYWLIKIWKQQKYF